MPAYDRYRTRCVPHYALSDASQKNVLQSGASVGRHNNKVDTMAGGALDDSVPGDAVLNHDFDLHLTFQGCSDFLQPGLRSLFPVYKPAVKVTGKLVDLRHYHMKNVVKSDSSGKLFCQFAGVADCTVRALREIDGDKNVLDAHKE